MPYLFIQTSVAIDTPAESKLLAAASQRMAEQLGKPERYVMVALQPAVRMLFAGDAAPVAYLELKSIGLPRKKTTGLSKALCDLLHEHLGIPADRVYIEFADAEPAMWGWDSSTF